MPFPKTRPPSNSNFFKPAQGPNRIRILADPIEGWQTWKDKKVSRSRDKEGLVGKYNSGDKGQRPKFFWAMPVWSYEAHLVMVWEVTQSTIMDDLMALNENEDWGSPTEYDVTIKRTGTTMEDTEYSVVPAPSKKLGQEPQDAWDLVVATGRFNLDALFDNGDPFDSVSPAESEAVTQAQEKANAAGFEQDEIPF